jgi:hypothetical protein
MAHPLFVVEAANISHLILRRPRSGRLEGWKLARHCPLPSFETRPAGAPQDEVHNVWQVWGRQISDRLQFESVTAR